MADLIALVTSELGASAAFSEHAAEKFLSKHPLRDLVEALGVQHSDDEVRLQLPLLQPCTDAA